MSKDNFNFDQEKKLLTNKLNNIKVKPLIINRVEPDKIVGFHYIPEPYANIFILGKKKSGKTTILAELLRKTINKNTQCFFFGSTINRDDTYKVIFEMLDKKGVNFEKYLHFVDSEEGNILDAIVDELRHTNEDESKDEEEVKQEKKFEMLGIRNPNVKLRFGNEEQEKKEEQKKEKENELKEKKKEKKSKKKEMKKKQVAKFCIVMDDLGIDMRSNSVSILLKTNRHFKAKTILLGHALTDLKPDARKQLDYVFLFHSLNLEKLKEIHQDLDLSTEFEDFKMLYDYATAERFQFLYIDVKSNTYRKGFSLEISVKT
jgi:hypothetical protein